MGRPSTLGNVERSRLHALVLCCGPCGAMEEAMTPAASYMRCSGKASLFGDTWLRQTESISACAAKQGFSIDYEFQEKAVPGKMDEDHRPAFQEMIATLLGNGCKTIIVESLDRLAREYRIQEQLVIYIASKELTLISANTGENITEAMMGDPMRRALVQIQGILAELDKNMIVAKLKKARERIRLTGKKVEGQKAYGVKPGEDVILKMIMSWRSTGCHPEQIAGWLNSQGQVTRYGKRWHAATISKIITRTNRQPSHSASGT
jgi:DNA invertase Pin-like site-specific DNA recombinase